MEVLLEIISGAAGLVTVGPVAIGFLERTKKTLRAWKTNKRAEEIRRMLEDLGAVTPSAIDDLLKQWVENGIRIHGEPGGPRRISKLSADSRDRVAELLLNLTREARMLTSRGTPRGTLARYGGIIEELIQSLNLRKAAGQPVGPGYPDWILTRLLGTGSFGEVWEGRLRHPNPHLGAGRTTARAFKFFTHASAKAAVLAEQEALTGIYAALNGDPHVAGFHFVAVEGQPYPFLVLEYIPGGSLEDWIMEPAARRVPLRKQEIIRGIVAAIARAHAHDITHRDLKPGNVLLTERLEESKRPEQYDVQAKIVDFGLAMIGAGRSQADTSDSPRGTPMYLPPEAEQLFRPRNPRQDDLFAIGVIWYQLLIERIERPPYDFAEHLRQLGHDTQTIRLISRCLADPDRRYADAQELAKDLSDGGLWPQWEPAPEGLYDVSHLVREYLTAGV
jgi:serine/threonine protein kinase